MTKEYQDLIHLFNICRSHKQSDLSKRGFEYLPYEIGLLHAQPASFKAKALHYVFRFSKADCVNENHLQSIDLQRLLNGVPAGESRLLGATTF